MYDKQQELELWKKYKDGNNKAKVELIKSLTPLLQKQVNRFVRSGLPRTALESEARKLAVEAFDTYDPTKAALNTHVVNHQKHLQRFVLNYQNVGKIPESRGLQISKFENIKRNLMENLGREPAVTELADALTWSTKEVERMESELRRDLSMISDKEENYFEDIMYDIEDSQDTTILSFIYFESPPETKLIMEYSFGMAGKPKLSVKDIAMRLGKTESYVRKAWKDLGQKINEYRTGEIY